MGRVVVVRSYPQGPRVWIAGQRVHHGLTGLLVALVLLGARRRGLAAACLLAVLHDRRDWRVWLAREAIPAGNILDGSENSP